MNLTHGLGIKASRTTFLIMIAGDTTLASPNVVANPPTPTPDRPHALIDQDSPNTQADTIYNLH